MAKKRRNVKLATIRWQPKDPEDRACAAALHKDYTEHGRALFYAQPWNKKMETFDPKAGAFVVRSAA